jgi:hypothetical protein
MSDNRAPSKSHFGDHPMGPGVAETLYYDHQCSRLPALRWIALLCERPAYQIRHQAEGDKKGEGCQESIRPNLLTIFPVSADHRKFPS